MGRAAPGLHPLAPETMGSDFLESWYQPEQNQDPIPTTCCLHPLPASCLPPGMQVWEQPLPQFSTVPSPFPSWGGQCWHMSGFKVSIGLFETSGAPLRYSKGDICPLPNRIIQDVRKDKARPRPALVVPHLLWLRGEKRTDYITVFTLQALLRSGL